MLGLGILDIMIVVLLYLYGVVLFLFLMILIFLVERVVCEFYLKSFGKFWKLKEYFDRGEFEIERNIVDVGV